MRCSFHLVNIQRTQEEVFSARVLSDDVKKIGTGILVGALSIPPIDFITNKVCELMESFKFDLSGSQDIIHIFEWVEGIGSKILQTALKTSLIFFVVILGPILEEIVFRGGFNVWVKNKMQSYGYDPMNHSFHKALYWTICGVAFGLTHLSPFQGWVNVPIVIGTSLVGILLSALKDEGPNDLTAPTLAHMTFNGIATAHFFLYKA